MLSDRAYRALIDIRDNIRFAQSWTDGLSLEDYAADRMVFYASTRCLPD